MCMTRQEALTGLFYNKFNDLTITEALTMIPAYSVLKQEPKDARFIDRHKSENAQAVSKAIMSGRKWPGDESAAARRLWVK